MKTISVLFLCFFFNMSTACIPTQNASLISVPEPIWMFNEPTVNKATVKAYIHIDTKGKVTVLEIISVTPNTLPIKPLRDAISLARFFPEKVQNKSDKTWQVSSSSMNYEFQLEW